MMHAHAQAVLLRQAGETMAAAARFEMECISTELVEHVFRCLDTETVVMVLCRVCRRWKDICAKMTFDDFDLSWALPPDGRGADATLAALDGHAAQSAAVCTMASRVGGARRVTVSTCLVGNMIGVPDTCFTDAALESVCKFQQLNELSLTSCRQTTAASMVHLRKLEHLSSLCLTHDDWVADPTLVHVGQIEHLTTLRIQLGQIADDGVAHLTNLQQLTTLDLSNCGEITDESVAHLAKIHRLQEVSLECCRKVTDAGVAHLRKLLHLAKLCLRRCTLVTSQGLAPLSKLRHLAELDLSSCRRGTTDTVCIGGCCCSPTSTLASATSWTSRKLSTSSS